MKTNNDPSTGTGTNKNKKIEELTDEQLKQVAGGNGECTPVLNCRTMSTTACECQECEDGHILKTLPSGRQVCFPTAIAGSFAGVKPELYQVH